MNPISLQGAYVTLEDLLRLRLATLAGDRGAKNARLGASGARLSRFRGRGIEFTEVRAYQPGDDVRSIDWKVTARRMVPHTKIYQEEREHPELLIIDQTRGMFFGTGTRTKSVTAAETAALLTWQYLDRGDRVGGIVLSENGESMIRPKRRTGAALRLLKAIAAANHCLGMDVEAKAHPLVQSLTQAKRIAHTGHGVHVISDFSLPIEILTPPLARLAWNNEVRLIFIYDEFEARPPVGRFALSQQGERLVFDTSQASLRTNFTRKFEQRLQGLRQICQRTGCRLVELPNQRSLLDRIDHAA